MNWEYLATQALIEGDGRRSHTYQAPMWRTPVPGGWLVMTVNARTSDPQPSVTFLPDSNHEWVGRAPAEASYLLRPAGNPQIEDTDKLLRPSDEN
ncbi:MAG: hypothetical protein ABJA67_05690 [Chthonomonadales bacterium]